MDDRDEARFERLEARLRTLEERLHQLESGAAPEPMMPATPQPPPPPVARPAPTAMPRPTRAAHRPSPAAVTTAAATVTTSVIAPAPTPAAARASTPAAGALPVAPAWQLARESDESAPPRQPISIRDLEERFAGRALAWVGGLALVAAAVFFLSLAFSRGWINEPLRVLVGLGVGAAATVLGAVFLDRRNPLMGTVLSGVGLGIISIALFAATRLYGLVPPEVGLLGALLAAAAAAAIAIRFDARIVAAFGLVAALVAPPLVGAPATLLTLAFVAVVLVGTTAISLYRSWAWLPMLAFLLAAPQLASWLSGDPDTAQALLALGGFWLVNVVAAAGEEARIRRDDLRPQGATLVLSNAAFLVWGGSTILTGDLSQWFGLFVLFASVAHLAVGAWFLRRQGLEHLFGNLVAGTGVALLALATFVQLGAAVVPIAWAAEAVALAWLAVRRRHRWSALAAVCLGALAVAHLLVVEFPLRQAGVPAGMTYPTPFLQPAAASLAGVLAALAAAWVVVPVRWIRSAVAAVGVLLAAHAATFELTSAPLAGALVALAVGGLLFDRLGEVRGTDVGLWPESMFEPSPWMASAAGFVSGSMAIALLFTTEFPPEELWGVVTTPVLGPETASLVLVVGGLVAFAALLGVRWIRSSLAAVGILLVTWALPFETRDVALIACWVFLLPVGVILDRGIRRWPVGEGLIDLRRLVPFELFATAAGSLAWLVAALYAIGGSMSPGLWGRVTPPPVPFTDERTLIAALFAASALAAARWVGSPVLRRVAVIAALVSVGLVVPFEVYADGVVVLWIGLAVLAVLATRPDPGAMVEYTTTASTFVALAAIVACAIVAPPNRLVVTDPTLVPVPPLLPGWPAAFMALALVLYAAPRHRPLAPWRTWLELASGVILVYLVSIAVVDVFQRMAGGPTAVEELAKQAQVALSVCWTAIGAAALIVGLATGRPMLRHAGLGLLGIATLKVFLIDLASMDVAYRALVLAGLGLLLLLSAWLFTRFRGPRAGAHGMPGTTGPAT